MLEGREFKMMVRVSGLRWMIVAVAGAALVRGAEGQARAYPKTWDLFGGGSYTATTSPSSHQFGWEASVTERPYLTHPWVGGTIEAGGAYAQGSNQIYTLMGGPAFVVPSMKVRPFGRALLGVVVNRSPGVGAVTVGSSVKHFGVALGGGVDVPIAPAWALRAQGDWLRSYGRAGTTINEWRGAVGLVVRF